MAWKDPYERDKDPTDTEWHSMTLEEKSKAMNKDIYDAKADSWKKEVHERFERWNKKEVKTEQIAFRCTLANKRLIEAIGDQLGMNISKTMEFIIACFFNETDPKKEDTNK